MSITWYETPGLLPPLLHIVCDIKLEALGTKLLEVVLEGNTVVLLLHNNVSTCSYCTSGTLSDT